MKSKYNVIVGILLTILFFAAFITGKVAEHSSGYGHIHEAISALALLFVILHISAIWKVFICHVKTLINISQSRKNSI